MGVWLREHLIAFLTLLVGVFALIAAIYQVPEFRWRVLHDPAYASHFHADSIVAPPASKPARIPPPPAVPPPPSPDPPARLVEFHARSVSASSVLPPSRVAAYDPENAVDGKWASVWVEGASGDGTGEWIQLNFPSAARITKLGVVNGYGNGPRFLENERIRDAEISFSDGSSRKIQLRDSNDLQYFDVGTHDTYWVRLTIESVYHGSRWTDAAIGEIRTWGVGGG